MTTTDIVMEIGADDLDDAINRTRYAISKQAETISEDMATDYGPLTLTNRERAIVRQQVTRLLNERLAVLEGPDSYPR